MAYLATALCVVSIVQSLKLVFKAIRIKDRVCNMVNDKVSEFIKNPKKALIALSLPVGIGMFVQTMYNIVDTAFVGRLGSDAIAALTFSFPIFFIALAISFGLSTGAGAIISRYLGAGEPQKAQNTAINGLLISLFASAILAILGLVTFRSVYTLLGASGDILNLTKSYIFIIFYGLPLMFAGYFINTIFSSQGDTKTPMIIQSAGLILNIILDPIFIFYFRLGVAGAAIATVISFAVSLALGIYFLSKKSQINPVRNFLGIFISLRKLFQVKPPSQNHDAISSGIKIKFKAFKFDAKIIKEIYSIGIPASLTMILISFYFVFINRLMIFYGVDYVSAFGLISRIESVAILPIVAISVASITLIGMFYGAKRMDLVKEISWYGIKIAVLISTGVGLIFFIWPTLFLRFFTPDQNLIKITAALLRIDVLTFPLMAISIVVSRIMQGMGNGLPGLIIQIVRSFIVAIPLGYLFVYAFHLSYLWMGVAMVLGGIISSIVAIIWLRQKSKYLKTELA